VGSIRGFFVFVVFAVDEIIRDGQKIFYVDIRFGGLEKLFVKIAGICYDLDAAYFRFGKGRDLDEGARAAKGLAARERKPFHAGVYYFIREFIYVRVKAAAEIMRFGVMAALAVMRAALNEHGEAHPRPVDYRVFYDPRKPYRVCDYAGLLQYIYIDMRGLLKH